MARVLVEGEAAGEGGADVGGGVEDVGGSEGEDGVLYLIGGRYGAVEEGGAAVV